ncbi:cytochrome P450 [Panus rudis PR-1116 ss-1]|nr:cytochrome P450 [Panus rudis PR-1116 ss-1]
MPSPPPCARASSTMSQLWFLLIIVSTVLLLIGWLCGKGRRERGLPPGPPTLPLLGNALDFPKSQPHLRFTEWARTYGEIFSLKVGSTTLVVLNSPRMVRQCLDVKGATTSDRPDAHVVNLVTGGMDVIVAHYGPTWRTLRRAAHDMLMKGRCMNYLPLQHAESSQLVFDLLHRPQDIFNHLRRFSTSVILSAAFGVRCPEYNNPYIERFFYWMHEWQVITRPGGHPPVDMFPILKYVPERWAPWKTACRSIRHHQRSFIFSLVDACSSRMRNEKRNGCFMEHVLDHRKEYGMSDEMIGYLGSALALGGSDTTSVYLQLFIQCLLAYPEVQARAQAEIDAVIGTNRMPTFEDIEALPYVRAIISEVHRFRPISPIGLPHVATTDETVDDYIIPNGTVIFQNIWAIYHDETLFDQPDVFNPDRFLHSKFGTKPGVDTNGLREDFMFGAGRRICPGIHLASNSININVLNLLWGFNLSPAIDPISGNPVPIDLDDYECETVINPRPFTCEITPRSEGHAQLIRSAFENAQSVFAQFEQQVNIPRKN